MLLAALALATLAQARTDEEKLAEVEAMFASPYGEEMVYRTDRLLLIATDTMRPLHKAPATATVITAQDIADMGATDLAQALEMVPGLHVGLSVLNRMNATYAIRGMATQTNPHVLLLVDGVPVTATYTGSRPESFRLPVANISRIEVVRGPGSAVYGADAFAGTINVVTRESWDLDGTRTGLRLGSFDTSEAWLQHGDSYGDWHLATSLELLESQGDRHRILESDQQSLFDTRFNIPNGYPAASLTPAALDSFYRIGNGQLTVKHGGWTGRLWGWLQDHGGMGAGATQTVAKNEIQVAYLRGELAYRFEDLAPHLDGSLRLVGSSYRRQPHFQLFPPGSILPIGTDGNIGTTPLAGYVRFPAGVNGWPSGTERAIGFDLVMAYAGWPDHRLRYGAGFRYVDEDAAAEQNFGLGILDARTVTLLPPPFINPGPVDLTGVTGTDAIFMNDQRRQQGFISLQDEWTLSRNWELVLGGRYDRYSDFGSTFNPRLGLIWDLAADLTGKLLYGRAFRPPSLLELYTRNNPATTGNPDLDPETIDSLELALDWQAAAALRGMVTLYAYQVDNLIEFIQTTPGSPAFVSQNARGQDGHGVEAEVEWRPAAAWRLRANVAWQAAADDAAGAPAAGVPGLAASADAHWRFLADWSVNGQVNWIGNRDRDRVAGDNRDEVPDYALVDAVLRWQPRHRPWQAAVAARNLFDTDAREPSPWGRQGAALPGDVPLAGRSLMLELQYRL
ncbi:MAG: TonB-dependent receptor [Thermodesulfobacteriota bacterium]